MKLEIYLRFLLVSQMQIAVIFLSAKCQNANLFMSVTSICVHIIVGHDYACNKRVHRTYNFVLYNKQLH